MICRSFCVESDDLARMCRLLERDYAVRGDAHTWATGRLCDWKYNVCTEERYFPSFLRRNAQLWIEAGGQVAGFLIAEDGDDVVTVIAPVESGLHAEIVDWLCITGCPAMGGWRLRRMICSRRRSPCSRDAG